MGLNVQLAYGDNKGSRTVYSPVITRVVQEKKPAAGYSILPIQDFTAENGALSARTRIHVLPTPHAKPGGPREINEAMVLEAAAPIIDKEGQVAGIFRLGTVINQNFDFVDFVRENIFTDATYAGKNLGTVTIFQGDVRITTNVIGPGTANRLLEPRSQRRSTIRFWVREKTWTGPAFVVDSGIFLHTNLCET